MVISDKVVGAASLAVGILLLLLILGGFFFKLLFAGVAVYLINYGLAKLKQPPFMFFVYKWYSQLR